MRRVSSPGFATAGPVWHHPDMPSSLKLAGASVCTVVGAWGGPVVGAPVGVLLALAGCGATPPSTTPPAGGDDISNTGGGDVAAIDARMSEAAFQALLERAALRVVYLEQVAVDPIGDVVEGRVMARGALGVTVETCAWPDVEFYVDGDDGVYAVASGHAGEAQVTEYQKRMPPRCARYEYRLPEGLTFIYRIEIEE